MLFIFVSCSPKTAELDRDDVVTSDGWIDAHASMYFNESCVHDLRYLSLFRTNSGYSPEEYHYVYCLNGNCDYAPHFERHDKLKVSSIRVAELDENGYYYHIVSVNCSSCKYHFEAFKQYCETQQSFCDGRCIEYMKNTEYTP